MYARTARTARTERASEAASAKVGISVSCRARIMSADERGQLFPRFLIVGSTPQEIGRQIGLKLGGRVKRCFQFYLWWFTKVLKLTEDSLRNTSQNFRKALLNYAPTVKYAEEIEAIAAASGLPAWNVYMLNCRTEIVNSVTADSKVEASECTSISFAKYSLLAQNWDWAKELEELTVVLHIRQENRPEILMICEPGIIGKIGLNSNSLGVCLNLLTPRSKHNAISYGVPVHVLLRMVLDSDNLDTALATLESVPRCPYSTSVLHCADQRRVACVELDGHTIAVETSKDQPLLRTNHFTGDNMPLSSSSGARFDRGTSILQNWSAQSAEDAKQDILLLLSDQARGASGDRMPIQRPFEIYEQLSVRVGTVTTVVMDLAQCKLFYTPGSPISYPNYIEAQIK